MTKSMTGYISAGVLIGGIAFIAYAGVPKDPKALFEETCSLCHSLDAPKAQHLSRTNWEATVLKMRFYGLWISDEDANIIIDYLSATYGEKEFWEEVSREGMIFGEGVVADPNGMVYFSSMTRALPPGPDNPGGTIFRFDPSTGKTTKYLEPSGMSNGLHFDLNGDLLIAQDSGGEGKGGGRAVMRRKLATGAMSVVADRYQGKHFNGPNDLTSDAKGRVYFTDARYDGTEPMELPNAVYRVDPDGKVTQLSTDIFRPNGIEVSPDGKRLYVAAANDKTLPTNPNGPAVDKFGVTLGGIVVYDLDSGGNISNGRLFFRNDFLMVDGMAMDRQGNLCVAMHNGNSKAPQSGIVVLNPEGQIVERILTPDEGLTTQFGFGRGADAGSLYVTTAFPIRLYRVKTVREGHYF